MSWLVMPAHNFQLVDAILAFLNKLTNRRYESLLDSN